MCFSLYTIPIFYYLYFFSGAIQNVPLQPTQVANVTGVSPVLSANTIPPPLHYHHPPPPPHLHQSLNAPTTTFKNKPVGPVQNTSNVQTHPKPVPNQAMKTNNENNQPPQ